VGPTWNTRLLRRVCCLSWTRELAVRSLQNRFWENSCVPVERTCDKSISICPLIVRLRALYFSSSENTMSKGRNLPPKADDILQPETPEPPLPSAETTALWVAAFDSSEFCFFGVCAVTRQKCSWPETCLISDCAIPYRVMGCWWRFVDNRVLGCVAGWIQYFFITM